MPANKAGGDGTQLGNNNGEGKLDVLLFLKFLGTAASKTCKLAKASLVNCTVNASNNTS